MRTSELMFGLAMIAASAAGFLAVGDVEFGSASQPGGAFFPFAASAGLLAAGLAYAARAAFSNQKSCRRSLRLELRPLLSAASVFAGGLFFCIALHPLGLPAATAGALLTAGAFSFKGASTVLVCILTTAACALLFHYGLGMDVSMLPAGFE